MKRPKIIAAPKPDLPSGILLPRTLCLVFALAFPILAHPQDAVHSQDAVHAQTDSPTAAAGTAPAAKKTQDAPTPAPPAPAVTDPRQAQILADSQKLLKLSQELKAELAKSNKDTLSLAVIKKAEEIERLARTLKDEMARTR
jgi:sRNA-binding protein